MTGERLGGHAVVEQLLELGADRGFAVPGESYLAVLDGLYDVANRFDLITARQEGGAAMMAAAHGKLTGKPGIALVTRGPGATNASIGVHIASQDASPMLLLVGQVPTDQLDSRAFQEIDYRAMFGSAAKAVYQPIRADRLPEVVTRAYRTAVSGEPGPVVLALPEDVLMTNTAAPVLACTNSPTLSPTQSPSPAAIADVVDRLARAERPLIVAGGSGWDRPAVDALRRFAEAGGYPVATAVRQQDLISHDSPVRVGTFGLATTPGLADVASEADLILLIGSRPDALTAADGDWLRRSALRATLIHVHPDPLAGNALNADLTVTAAPTTFAPTLAGHSLPAKADPDWLSRLRCTLDEAAAAPVPGGDPRPFMDVLEPRLPEDAILTAGAGAYTVWHQRFHAYRHFPSQVSSQSGAMGYGLPAAISAKLAHPEREVVAFAGDGCFAMNGQELSTAVRYGLGITVVVVNNEVYGTIRGHQRREFPGRPSGTALQNPDFAALARAHGAHGATVSTPEEFASALDARPGGRTPSLIEVDFPYV